MAGPAIQGTFCSNWKRAGGRGVREVRGQVQGAEEGEERDAERGPLHGLAAVGQEREQKRAGERDEDDEREDDVIASG